MFSSRPGVVNCTNTSKSTNEDDDNGDSNGGNNADDGNDEFSLHIPSSSGDHQFVHEARFGFEQPPPGNT